MDKKGINNMIDNQIFAWGNYDNDPQKMIGVDSLATQKGATYNSAADGVFTGNVKESFFTNDDKSLVSNPAMVIGEVAMELVFGKGAVANISVTYITNAEEFEAEKTKSLKDYMQSEGHVTEWQTGMCWAVANFSNISGTMYVTNNGEVATMIGSTNGYPVSTKSTYLIVDKGEVEDCADVHNIGFKLEA